MLADTQETRSLLLVGVFQMHRSLLCTAPTFSQSRAVYHMGLTPLEFQPARLGTGEILTICSKIKK